MSPAATALAQPSRRERWGERCLTITRVAAVTAVGAVPYSAALTSLACSVMLLSWLVSGQAHSLLADSLRRPLGLAFAVFFTLAAAAMLYSPASWKERLDILWGWRRFGYALILLGVFAPDVWKRRFLKVFLASATIGLAGSFLSWMQVIGTRSNEFTGIVLQNHSTQGVVFSVAILCAGWLARTATSAVRRGLFAAMALFTINILFVTPGRSGYVALVVVAVAAGLMFYGRRRAWLWLPLAAALAVAALAASPVVRDRFEQGWQEIAHIDASPANTSMGRRIVLWSTALELIGERPLLGYGTGSFGREYSARVAQRYTDWRSEPLHEPHNQYLYITVELGFVGLLAFCAILAAGFLAARASPYGWLVGGVLAAWCATSLFNSHFRTFPEGHLIGLFLGALLAPPARDRLPLTQ